jgi:hypothetical protein
MGIPGSTPQEPDSYPFSRFQGREGSIHTLKHRLQPICTGFGERSWDFRGDMGREGEFPRGGAQFRNLGVAEGKVEILGTGFYFSYHLNPLALSLIF